MSDFKESMRYDYPLNRDSVVVDAGGFKGQFSKEISSRYNCNIFLFEPVREYFEICLKELGTNPKIHLQNSALAGPLTPEWIYVHGDSTGVYSHGDRAEKIKVVPSSYLFRLLGLSFVDLLKLNIEGSEFDFLENIIDKKYQALFGNIQVQFHQVVPNYEQRYQAIRDQLLKTHVLTFDFPWCWQNFKLK